MPQIVPPKLIPPSRTFYVQGSQGADAELPPQPVSSWTLFRPEDFLWLTVTIWRKSGGEGFIAFDFPPQHMVESDAPGPVVAPILQPTDPRVVFDYPYGVSDPRQPRGPFAWTPPAPGELALSTAGTFVPHRVDWWADVGFTRGTRVCFHIPAGLDAVVDAANKGNIAALLNWSSWDLCLMPWGQSNATFLQHPRTDTSAPPVTQDQAESATRLAMIFGMVLTPTDSGGWTHFDSPVTLNGRTELWHTRLVPAKAEPTLRAVWSLGTAITHRDSAAGEVWDALPSKPRPGDPLYVVEPDTALTTASDIPAADGVHSVHPREKLVELTSSMAAGVGAREMPALDTALSAIGGTLTTAFNSQNPKLSFHHSQVLGRDVADSCEKEETLCPFGQPVSIENHRSRSVPDRNGLAVIPTIFTMRVLDPLRTMSTQDMKWPFRSVRLLTRVIRALVFDPTTGTFLDATTHEAVLLSYEAIDLHGQAIRFEQPVMTFERVQQSQFRIDLRQQRVGFAATNANNPTDNTLFETDALTISAATGSDPTVIRAVIRHPALQHFRTDAGSDTITVAPSGSLGDQLGSIVGDPNLTVDARVAAGGLNTARYGAFAAPNLTPHKLSKALGAAGSSLDGPGDAQTALGQLLGDTKILGIFTLTDLLGGTLKLNAGDLGGWLAANGPTITSTRSDQSLTVSVSLDAKPAPGTAFFSTSFSVALLSARLDVNAVKFDSRIVAKLANPQDSSTSAECVLTAPRITLGFGTSDPKPELLEIQLKDLRFQTSTGTKPSFSTDFDHFQFLGDLAFLNGVIAVLPSNLFSNPPQLTIDDQHAEVNCSVGLPSFGFGVFGFSNVGLDTGAVVRFDGHAATGKDRTNAPLAFHLDFSTPDKPFSVVVALLEGQGSFGMTITPGGVAVDASLAFGGAFELDLKVIKGGVALTAGIHFRKGPDTLDVAGFLHLSGGVEVLGLIGVTVDTMMSLSWDGHAFSGTVKLSITVDLLFLHKSVSVTFTKTFAGSSQAPTIGLPLAPALFGVTPPGGGAVDGYGRAWAAYCGGFAA